MQWFQCTEICSTVRNDRFELVWCWLRNMFQTCQHKISFPDLMLISSLFHSMFSKHSYTIYQHTPHTTRQPQMASAPLYAAPLYPMRCDAAVAQIAIVLCVQACTRVVHFNLCSSHDTYTEPTHCAKRCATKPPPVCHCTPHLAHRTTPSNL